MRQSLLVPPVLTEDNKTKNFEILSNRFLMLKQIK